MPKHSSPVAVRVVKRKPAKMLAALAGAGVMGWALMSCSHHAVTPAPVPVTTEGDYSQWTPCQHEDGSGDGQVFPCVWDADTRGNGLRGAHSPRWTVFVRAEDGCPPQVGVDGQSACVFAVEWSAEAGD